MKRSLLVFGMLFAVSISARASSAIDLYHRCQAATARPMGPAIDASYCIGFINGVSETLEQQAFENKKLHRTDTRDACVPKDVGSEQIIKVFLKYADDHPEQLNLPASGIVMLSLVQAFPCSASGG